MNDKKTIADTETRATAQDHHALRLWLRVLACTNLIEGHIRSRLRNQFDTTLPRFDLMAQLERSPNGLKMGELSKRMMVTGGNVTTIVDQLEREQLVQRLPVAGDRRSYRLTLTDAGRNTFATMAQAHEAWVRELLSPLSSKEQGQLATLLGTLKTANPRPVRSSARKEKP